MFSTLFVFGAKLTAPQMQQFLQEYYPYAYTLVESFKTPYLGDDEKENIAWTALERAIKTFDTEKGTKFSSYLYLLISNDMKSAITKKKKLPLSIREVPDEEGETKDIFEFIEDYKAAKEFEPDKYQEIKLELSKRLTPRQKQLVDMLESPEVYIDKYNKQFKPEKLLKKLNYDAIGAMLNVSIATISFELKKIRDILSQTLKEIDLK